MKQIAVLLIVLAPIIARADINVGWIGPLTGNSAVVGIDSVPAMSLVFDKINARGGINGQKVRLIVEDDAYNVVRAVSAYKRLVHTQGVRLIVMLTYGGVFATAKDAVRDGVLVIDALNCNDDIARLPDNTMCLATQTESIAEAFASDIINRNFQRVFILLEESDGWMQFIETATRRLLKAKGITVLTVETLSSADNYRDVVLRAKKEQVSALVLLGNDQMGLALRQAREIGITAQVYGIGSLLSPGFQKLAAGSVEGALVSSWAAPDSEERREFTRLFKEKVGRGPYLELAAIPAYDTAQMLALCLEEVLSKSGEMTSAKMRSCLLRQQRFRGASGEITFEQDGAVRSLRERLFRVRQGKLHEIAGSE